MTLTEGIVLAGYVLAVCGALWLMDLLEDVRGSRPARGSRASGRRRTPMRRRPCPFERTERFR